MTDLLLYFALATLAAILLCAALFWLKWPAKAEVEWRWEPSEEEKEEHAVMGMILNAWVHEPNKGFYYALEKIDEDTRPLPAHEEIDSFDYDELWEAAAKIPRESQAQREQIDKWEREAFKDAGEDYEL